MHIEPLDATFGATVTGLDLRSLDDATWAALHATWLEHALLIFPGQFLDADAQNAFARAVRDLEFEAAPISNVGRDGTVHAEPDDDVVKSLRGNEGWHHDSTYMPMQAKGAVFSAEIVPTEGGRDRLGRHARGLRGARRRRPASSIADKPAYHSLYYSQARAGYMPSKQNDGGGYDQYGYHDMEPSLRPLVKVHPDTGRPNLLHRAPRLRHRRAWIPTSPRRLLDRLNEWACQPPRVYFHQWEVGDASIWDNRRLMHRATPFDMTQPRRMWHTRIAGERASELAVNHR